jgi:A nuclease family of the HNH/ENDO VII superfamily with conserved AHH
MPSAAQVEINTEVAQKLQRVLAAAKKRKFKPSPALKKHEREKNKGKPVAQKHVDANARPEAVLGKNSSYRENGTKYLRAQNGRDVYRNFSHPHLKKIKDLARSVAEFPEGPPQNFDRKAPAATGTSGAKWPYAWEAHHMIPGEVFTHMKNGAEGGGEPVFTPEQYDLLLKSDYDINNGHNIIMLPDEAWAVPIHVLLQHPSNHPEYTKMVIMQCQTISEMLQSEVAKKKKDHKELTKPIVQELHDLEDDLWDYLVDLSKRVVNAVIEGQEFEEGEPVRFASNNKKNGSTYKWGALY